MENSLAREYLTSLGVGQDVTTLYLALAARSPQTISQLARSSGIERTRIYRLLDDLKASQLIEVDEEYARGLLRAAPITNLELLLTEREQQTDELRSRLPEVVSALQQSNVRQHDASVQFYRGVSGLRQLLWNQTRSDDESLSILVDTIQTRTDARFFERWAEQHNRSGAPFRSIVGDEFSRQLHDWYGPRLSVRLKHWEGRYVSPEQFRITTNTLIYGNTVAFYSWNGTETFGVELQSAAIAEAQRQLFELLWHQAQPYPMAS